MKKQLIYRILGIGLFHAVLYLYVVPFLIYPVFGQNGLVFSIILAIIISVAVFGTIILNKKKGERHE